MKSSYKIIARNSHLLSSMPDDLKDVILNKAQIRNFDQGQMIFSHREPATNIYIVFTGWVKLFRVPPNGAEAVMGVFTQGRSFGEAVAFKGDPYPVSAEAVTDTTLIKVSVSHLLDLMAARPEIAVAILASTFAHLHGLVSQVEQLKARTGPQRLAEFLLSLTSGTNEKCSVTLPYDKALIAGRLGMKPERLSRAFAKLKKIGVTIDRNAAHISSISELAKYAESDPADAWTK